MAIFRQQLKQDRARRDIRQESRAGIFPGIDGRPSRCRHDQSGGESHVVDGTDDPDIGPGVIAIELTPEVPKAAWRRQ